MVHRHLGSRPARPVGQVIAGIICLMLCAAAHGRTLVRITPNALQVRETPMVVEVTGVGRNDQVSFEIREDCEQERSECPKYELAIEGRWWLGTYRADVDLSDSKKIPADKRLHLWTTIVQDEVTQTHATLFSVRSGDCGLLRTVWAMFASGECDPEFGRALTGAHFGVADSEDETQTTIGVLESEKAKKVPGTQGATGVAWRSADTLLFTSTQPALGNAPGLYQVLATGRQRKLVFPVTRGTPLAPFVLKTGAVGVFVDQGASWEAWILDPVSQGAADAAVPPDLRRVRLSGVLHPSVHVLSTTSQELLVQYAPHSDALALVDLSSGTVQELPFDRGLSIRSRARFKEYYPVEHRDSRSTSSGMNISGVDSKGEVSSHFLVDTVSDERFPVASPDGNRLAWVAQGQSR